MSRDYTLIRIDRTWSDNNGTIPKKGGRVAMFNDNNLNYSDISQKKHLNTSTINIIARGKIPPVCPCRPCFPRFRR